MVIAPLLRTASLKAMLVPAGLFLATFLVSSAIPTSTTSKINFIALNSPYLLFMFIGVAFNFFYRGRISAAIAAALIAALSLMFGICLTYGFFKSPILPSYALALIVFVAAFKFPALVTKIPTIDFWAKISYPLYVVHALSGYVMLILLLHFRRESLGFVTPDLCSKSQASRFCYTNFSKHPSHRFGQRLAIRLRGYINRRRPARETTTGESSTTLPAAVK